MRKILIFAFAALMMAVSCAKKDFTGTYLNQRLYGTQSYMGAIVGNYLTDHLWVAEQSLQYDKNKVYEALPKTKDFDTGGKSIWQVGTVWTVSIVTSLEGITMERTQEDSTWVLKRNADAGLREPYAGSYHTSFPTDSEVTLRMLPTEEGAPRHEWKMTVTRLVRTEDLGYKADIKTVESAIFRVAESQSGWGHCFGAFHMTVTKNDDPVDEAVLSYDGDAETAMFYHEN